MFAARAQRSALRASRRLFSTAEAAGVKVASVDDLRPVSQLSLVVKAGSRFETAPGVAHYLEKFAFRDTAARSALRLTRESELLGGRFFTKLGREELVLTTQFLREDLPYFVNALADVVEGTQFKQWELDEVVRPAASLEARLARADAAYEAVEAAYMAAFHNGLANSVIAGPEAAALTLQDVKNYATQVLSKANIRLVARGVDQADLVDMAASRFDSIPAGAPAQAPKTAFFGGNARVRRAGASALTIAFPAAPSAELEVLRHALDASAVKWSVGSSLLARVAEQTGADVKVAADSYSDAGLLHITVSAPSAKTVRAAATEAVKAVQAVAAGADADAAKRAVSRARFAQAFAREADPVLAASPAANVAAVSESALKDAAASLLKGKVAVAAVGDVANLPYAEDLF